MSVPKGHCERPLRVNGGAMVAAWCAGWMAHLFQEGPFLGVQQTPAP
jgi:hypothetical protein